MDQINLDLLMGISINIMMLLSALEPKQFILYIVLIIFQRNGSV